MRVRRPSTIPSAPARFAARIVGCAAVFAALSKGATGEIYLGLRSGEGIGLSACLWAWRLGIPLTGAIIPIDGAGGASAGIDAAFGGDPDGFALASRFEEGRPGLGALDYRTYLRRLAALPQGAPLMLEHLPNAEEYDRARLHVFEVGKSCGISF